MDGDGQHAPEDIAHFLPLLDKYDLILGNRMEDSGRVPLLRRIANQSSSLIVSALCVRRIYDSQTGFRAYRTDLETEVIIKAARMGLRIGHCRIQTIYADEVSRFKIVKDSLRFIRVVFK